MADVNTSATTGTPAEPHAPVQPQAGVPPTPTATTTAATTAAAGTPAEPNPGTEPMTLDEAKKLRAEAHSLRKRLADYEAAQQAAELAKLSETEKLQKQYEQAQQQLAALQIEQQQSRLAREIAKHGPSLNLIDPDAAQALLERDGEIEHDADGKPTNVAKLLERLIAAKPWLVASNVRTPPVAPSSGGATNRGRSAGAAQPPTPAARPDAKAAYAAHKQSGGLGNKDLWNRSTPS